MTLGQVTPGELPDARIRRSVSRVRFLAGSRPDEKVIRTYEQPRVAYATEEVDAQCAPADASRREPVEQESLMIVWVSPESSETVAIPAVADRQASIIVTGKGGEAIAWRPGVVVARCAPEARQEVTAALLDFCFLENELRLLEVLIGEAEQRAEEHLPVAHRLNAHNGPAWESMARMFERVTAARLTFARVEPQFVAEARDLGTVGRRWFARLARKARIAARLEASSDRLEALEDFYEGANQRIAEFRWYREGHRLEKTIIAILLLESALMIVEIVLHLRR